MYYAILNINMDENQSFEGCTSSVYNGMSCMKVTDHCLVCCKTTEQSIEQTVLLSLTDSFSFLSEIKYGTTLTRAYALLALLDQSYTC